MSEEDPLPGKVSPAHLSVRGWADLAVLPILGFVLLFSLLPLLVLFSFSYGELGGWTGLWGSLWGSGAGPALARRALGNSLEQGALSAFFAVAWGLPVGIYLGIGSPEWVRRLRGFLLLPFLLPSLVMAFGVLALFGTRGTLSTILPATRILASGLPAIVLVNVLYNVPLVALYTATLLEEVPSNLSEAARTLGASRWRAFRTVWGRPCALGATLGGTLTFLLSFLSFAPPLLLGGPSYYTVEDWIYSLDKLVGPGGPALASALALWAVGLLALPMAVYLLLLRGTNLVGRGPGTQSRSLRGNSLARSDTLILGGATAILVGLEVLLLVSVLTLSLTSAAGTIVFSNWSSLASSHVENALGASLSMIAFNTLFFAVVASALVLALTLPLFLARRPTAGGLGALTFLPLLLSPVVLALGLEVTWGGYLGSASTVWVLIVLSQAALALPLGLQALGLSFAAIPSSIGEAARTLGASRWKSFAEVEFPLATPGVRAAVLLTLAVGLGEFAATNFLFVPRFTTLTVEMYLLEDIREPGASFAAAALLLLLSLLVFAVLSYFRWAEARTERSSP